MVTARSLMVTRGIASGGGVVHRSARPCCFDAFSSRVPVSTPHQLAPQRFQKCLANLDPAARQMPAGNIAVPDQEHLVVAVEHEATDPERHAAGDPPVEMEYPPQQRLKAFSNILQDRHENLEWA